MFRKASTHWQKFGTGYHPLPYGHGSDQSRDRKGAVICGGWKKTGPRLSPGCTSIFFLLFIGLATVFSLAQEPSEVNKEKAELLVKKGKEAFDKGNYREALEDFKQSVMLFEQMDDPGVADASSGLAGVYKQMEKYDEAVAFLEKALRYHEAKGNKGGIGAAMTAIAEMEIERGHYKRALEVAEQALKIHQELGNQEGMADTFRTMANVQRKFSDYNRALQYTERSLKTAEEIGDKEGVAASLNATGIIYNYLSDYTTALDYYQRALRIGEEFGNQRGVAASLYYIGNVHWYLGDYTRALEYHQKSFKIKEAMGDQGGMAASLNGIGSVHWQLGNYTQALEYCQKALGISRQLGDRRGIAMFLGNIGALHQKLGRYAQALESIEKAVGIASELEDKVIMASNLNILGMISEKLGRYAKALEYCQRSLKTREEMGDRWGITSSLFGLASVQYKTGRMREAEQTLSETIRVSREIGNPEILWSALYLKSLISQRAGEFDQAMALLEEAVQVIEKVRRRLDHAEQKVGFLAGRLDVYENIVTLLARRHALDPQGGYDREAFHYAEKAKARALLDLLEESKADVHLTEGVDPDLRQRERVLQARLSHWQVRWYAEHTQPKPDAERLRQIEKSREDVYKAYEDLQHEMKERNPRYADLKYPEPVTLETVQPLLDAQTALLEYLTTPQSIFLFVVTRSAYKLYRLPKSRKALETEVKQLRTLINDPTNPAAHMGYVASAYELYALLIKPASPLLKGKRKIIVAVDGVLTSVPLEALLTGKIAAEAFPYEFSRLPYLVKRYAISYVQSASVLCALARNGERPGENQKKFLAFADPVYDQDRKGRPRQDPYRNNRGALTRIRFSGEEVRRIATLYGSGESDVFLRQEATEDHLKFLDLTQYKTIHFAAHGLLNEARPEFSAIALTQKPASREDGFLHAYEIFNLRLRADLVVLSACETGLGPTVQGEGLISLTRAFMYAGAGSVLASLWKIDDASTFELMYRFYQNLEKPTEKVEALREAQMNFMAHRPAYAHPYFWAAFILYGPLR